ncbi:MAG: hypothetical protein ORN26_02815 [Candidatus Pacebacteria bacterium]|nr:hypothetical protein [Candidatus Paceibacterota bacterium]
MANKSDNLIKLKNNRITTPPFILIDHKKDNSIIIEKYFKSPQDIE